MSQQLMINRLRTLKYTHVSAQEMNKQLAEYPKVELGSLTKAAEVITTRESSWREKLGAYLVLEPFICMEERYIKSAGPVGVVRKSVSILTEPPADPFPRVLAALLSVFGGSFLSCAMIGAELLQGRYVKDSAWLFFGSMSIGLAVVGYILWLVTKRWVDINKQQAYASMQERIKKDTAEIEKFLSTQ